MARERAESEGADEHPEYDIAREDFPENLFKSEFQSVQYLRAVGPRRAMVGLRVDLGR